MNQKRDTQMYVLRYIICVCVYVRVCVQADYVQGVGRDQQIGVVKQSDVRPLHQQEEDELDEQHESQLPYAADMEEHRAGQQGQQHTVAEILHRRRGEERRV